MKVQRLQIYVTRQFKKSKNVSNQIKHAKAKRNEESDAKKKTIILVKKILNNLP